MLFVATLVIFFGVSAAGDPLGELRQTPNISQTTLDNIVERKHLDQPLIAQYGFWLRDAVTDRFGTNLFGSREIWPELTRAFWYTLQLVLAAEVIALVLGIAIGVLGARRQYSFFDYTATTVSFLGYSVPIFWFALVLQVVFTNIFRAFDVRIFYTAGANSVNPGTGFSFLLDRLQHLALPIIAIAFVSVALYSRYMRASFLEVAKSDYVRTARAKGVKEGTVTRRHALRNALIPIATVAALQFGSTFGGAIVTETIFGIPGMGRFFIEALTARDAYEVMAFLVVTAVLIILFNLIADVLYGVLDPRIRL